MQYPTLNFMKGALIGLFIGIVLLVLQFYKNVLNIDKETIDVHIRDTYFVLSFTTVMIFLFLFLGTFFSVGGLIGSHFRSNVFWVLAVLFLLVDTYYIMNFFK